MSRARPELVPAPVRRPRTALPARITDNLNGRALEPSKVAREITFVLGPEILARLQRRRNSP